MEALQSLYFALGEMAYAVAKADGKVQRAERTKLHDIVVKEAKLSHPDIDISEIIFHILQKSDRDFETAYQWSMDSFKEHRYWLTEDMKADFIAVIEKVAHAFNSVTNDEKSVIERFRKDMEAIKSRK